MKKNLTTKNFIFSTEEVKYLEMLQKVILRMASNSFEFKKWYITILSGCFALFIQYRNIEIIGIALFVTIFFGVNDFYYLCLEKKFRNKYKDATQRKATIFDMDIQKVKIPILKIARSLSLAIYYIPSFILLGCLFFFY